MKSPVWLSKPRARPTRSPAQTLSLYFDPDRGVVPKEAELDVKGLGQVIQFMAEAGELKPPSSGTLYRLAIPKGGGTSVRYAPGSPTGSHRSLLARMT
jgi:hypothetical protein